MTSTDHPDTFSDADAAAFELALGSARMFAWEWEVGSAQVVRLAGNRDAVFGPVTDGTPHAYDSLVGAIHPDDRERVDAVIARTVEERGSYRVEFRTLHADGSVHWAVAEGRVMPGAGGAGLRIVGTTRNADADRDAATQARSADDARARLDAFFQTAPIGLALLDADLRYLQVNETLAAAHGTPALDHVGRRPAEVMPAAVARIVDAEARRALDTGLPVEDVPLPGGTAEAPQQWSAGFFPALTPSGERAGVGMLARDVTDAVRAEAERAATTRRTTMLAEAGRLLETSLDYDGPLERLAGLVVQHFGAWCIVDLLEGDRLQPVVTLHRDAAKVRLGRELTERRRASIGPDDVPTRVARTGKAVLLADVGDDVLQTAAGGDEDFLALLRELELRSALSVPLTARDRTLGVLTVVAEGDRRFDQDDLALAVELGRRAALAVDNARLYRTAMEEQRRSEEARATLDGYLERAPVGFALFDAELRFVRVNAALAAISGLPAEEHVGHRAGALLGEAGDQLDDALVRVLGTGDPAGDLQLRGVLPGSPGRERQLLVSAYRVPLPGGEAPGVGVTVVEVTERLRVEQALTGQRDLYETLLRAQSAMGEAFVLLEGERAIYVNEAAERMTMRTARDLYDMASLRELVPEEHHADLVARVGDVLKDRESSRGFETEITTPTGARIAVEVNAQPLDADGRRRLVVVARDVSERRRQEMERERLLRGERRARREIEIAHERARMLAELSEVLDRSMDLRRTLPEAGRVLIRHGANVAGIDVLVRDGATLVRMAVSGDTPERDAQQRVLTGTEYPLASPNPWAEVARTRRPIVTGDLSVDVIRGMAGSAEELELLLQTAPRSVVFLPLVARGRTVGVVGLGWDAAGNAPEGAELAHLQEVARRLATGIDNAQLYAERAHIASTLQAGLLPPRLPAIPGIEAAARYLPAGEASEVGGDFYDLYAIADGRWAVVVGDVCGKGAEAAAVTAMARYTLRAAAIAGPSTPARALELLNAAMVAERLAERFLTAVLGELRLLDGHADLDLACAGHPAPIVVRAGGRVEAVAAAGPLLGVAEGITWESTTLRLGPGDAVVLYTDGVTEADRRRPMTPRQLAAELAAAHPDGLAPSADALADAVRRVAEERAGGPLRDDVAIVALRLTA